MCVLRLLCPAAIPFLSSFLSKLLTVDLPRLLVLPRHITFDFLPAGEDVAQHMASAMVLDLLKSETFTGLAGERPFSPSASSGSRSLDGVSATGYEDGNGALGRQFSLSSLAGAAAMGAVTAAMSNPGLVPTRMEPSDAFVGELSVTLCEARNLPSFGMSGMEPNCRFCLTLLLHVNTTVRGQQVQGRSILLAVG